jgi:hypothetical protein
MTTPIKQLDLPKAADMMYETLRVTLQSDKLRPLLEVNDPKALRQALDASLFYSVHHNERSHLATCGEENGR